MWRTFSKQKNQNIRHHKSLSAFQQIIASHQFQDDCEVDNVASRRLMTQDTEHHQHGVEKLTIFLFWGGATWKTFGLTAQLSLKFLLQMSTNNTVDVYSEFIF
jgi:hypothetical protein